MLLNEQLRIATDAYIDRESSNAIYTRAGVELNITDGLILRSGINNSTIFAGAFADTPIGQIDFGLKDFESDEETQVSLGYQIGIGHFPMTIVAEKLSQTIILRNV